MYRQRLIHALYRIALVCTILAAGSFFSRAAQAASMREHAESLAVVPEDAAFYVAWLKNREQFEAMQETNAWNKLISIPVLQMGWMQAQTQWQFPTDERVIMFKEWFDSDEGQDVWSLVLDMMSDEVVMYGDRSVATLLELGMEMNSQITRAQFSALRDAGDTDALEDQQAIQAKLMELLEQHAGHLNVPNMALAFKISDTDRAVRVLDAAQVHLRTLLENPDVPEWVQENVDRKQVSDYDLLTLTITGDQIPWEQIEEEADGDAEMLDEIKELVEDKRVILSVGVVGNFFVFTVSDSMDMFDKLGSGDLLADTKEFERLDQHADQNIVSIGYVSEEMMQAAGSQQRSFGDMAMMAKGFLSLADLTKEQVEKIESDIDDLTKDILKLIPEPGALASTSFTTERGYETYSYNWGTMPDNLDGSKPLTLVDHMGEDSIGWYVARGKQSTEGYDEFVDWCKRGLDDFEMIAKTKSSPEDWEQYEKVRDEALPLVKQLDEATRKYMVPGFADGQGAIVFEATASDDTWCEFIPTSNTELPLPTIAFVYGVSDAGAVRQGAAEYFDIAQQVIDKAHEANPDDVPMYTLPEPNESTTTAGAIYSYELPAEWGMNDRVAPNAGLSDSVMVLSALPEVSERLLAESKPAVDGPVADFSRPLLSAGHFKFAKFIETTKPWIDYGIQVAVENAGDEGGRAVMMVGMFKPQFEQFLDVAQCLDSFTSVTYKEDNAWVTHSEMRIIDLED